MGNGTVVGPFFFRQNIDGDDYLQLINDEIDPALRPLRRYRGRRNDQFRRIGGHRTVHLHTGEESSQIV